MTTAATIQADVLHSFVEKIFVNAGVLPEHAADAANVLLYASAGSIRTASATSNRSI